MATHVLSPSQQDPGGNVQRAQPAPASPLPTLGPAQRTRLNWFCREELDLSPTLAGFQGTRQMHSDSLDP